MNARTFVVVMAKPGQPSRFLHTHAFTTVVVPTWELNDEQSLAILQGAFADEKWVLETSQHVRDLVAQSISQALTLSFAQKGIVFQTDIVEPT